MINEKKITPKEFAKAIGGELICGALAHPACGKLAQGKRCQLAKDHPGDHKHVWADGETESVWVRE